MTAPVPSEQRLAVSEVLGRFVASHPEARFSLGALTEALGDRTYGVLFIVLALPNVIPLPGLLTVVGLPMALIGAQMALGWPRPWLPQRVAALTFDCAQFAAVIARATPYMQRIERRLRPSWSVLVSPAAERGIGLFVMGLGLVLALPIPFGNSPPALAVAIVALGQIERDGRYVLVGFATGVVAVAIAATVVTGMIGGAVLVARQFLA